jgi:hypothetical protein
MMRPAIQVVSIRYAFLVFSVSYIVHFASAQYILSDLRDTTHQITYLIISPPEYISELQSLADFRKTHNGFSVGIAVTDSIYSLGTTASPDTAIKQFISYTFSS